MSKDVQLFGETKAIHLIEKVDLDRCFELFTKFYDNVDHARFISDFNNKTESILLRDANNIIQGFCNLTYYTVNVSGEKLRVIFTGDTIIHPDFWGTNALSYQFFKTCMKQKLVNPTKKVCWFLLSKGYKTYLTLANNVLNYYPRYDKETPERYKDIIEHLSNIHYPNCFNKETGLIEFQEGEHEYLKEGIAEISPDLIDRNRKIAFFSSINKTWKKGSELPCIGFIQYRLMFFYPWKILKKLKRKLF